MHKKNPPPVTSIKRRPLKWLSLLVLLLAFALTMCSPPRPLAMTVLGHPHTLIPGSQGSLQVHVLNRQTNEPAADAQVTAYLTGDRSEAEVFAGQTDADGMITVQFEVPAEGESSQHWLSIRAEKNNHTAHYQQPVYIGHIYHTFVSTDKPVYQPGQTIHLRTLALDSQTMQAAQEQPLTLTVQDPQGNRLMRQELTTSRWGITSADFILDSQATSGDYTIIAEMGSETSRRTVEVKPYTLPRFKINFQSDKSFYLPGETASISLDAQYFFGKPVSGGQVQVKGYLTDVGRELFFELDAGELDAQGFYQFDLPLPDFLVAQVEDNIANIDLEITVIDAANHAENSTESLSVAEQALLIEAVPESGTLRPGIENIIYLSASYPNGQPAQAELTISLDRTARNDGFSEVVQTNENGLATIRFTPPSRRRINLEVSVSDDQGQTAQHFLSLNNAQIPTGYSLVAAGKDRLSHRRDD